MTIRIGGSGTLLTIVFFLAKILGYIQWSWLWVFAPIWIPFVFMMLFFAFVVFLAILGSV